MPLWCIPHAPLPFGTSTASVGTDQKTTDFTNQKTTDFTNQKTTDFTNQKTADFTDQKTAAGHGGAFLPTELYEFTQIPSYPI